MTTSESIPLHASAHCAFVADIGYVTPLEFRVATCKAKVLPYLDATPSVRLAAASHLADVWADETGASSASDAAAFIERTWSSADLMYVMTTGEDDAYVGAVAVDRKNMVPCISHLMVLPEHRRRGYGRVLMACAEAYVKKCLSFVDVTLWCQDDMVPFYERQGYAISGVHDSGAKIMRKRLIDSKNPRHKAEWEPMCAEADAAHFSEFLVGT